MAEVYDKDFRARGVTHTLSVAPNDNNTGWVIFVGSFSGGGAANLPQDEAIQLAELLLSGPGDIVYECSEHLKISGVCLECLK